MLKTLQARLQQYMNNELPDVQAGFRKGRGTRDQIANIHWMIEKHESSRKTSTYGVNDNKLENCSRDGNTKPPYLSPEKTCMQLIKQQPELDLERTRSKLGKEYVKAIYCHLTLLI